MASTFLKPTVIAATALGLLQREIVLPALVTRLGLSDFKGAAGDTVTMRVPARTKARTRPLRGARTSASEGEGIIQMDDLTEMPVDVSLTEAVYNAVAITDEQLSLDIMNFGEQVLTPQITAVAEGLESNLVARMTGATYATTLTLDQATPYNTFVDARVVLNKANVPANDRIVVLGADMEGIVLKSAELHQVDKSGDSSALRDATLGRLAGFGQIVVSNALPGDFAVAYHRSAFVMALVAPSVPDGATFGESRAFNGIGLRWLRDYDFRNVQDRSLVDAHVGSNIVADGRSNEVQTITITGAPTGGTFTLSYSGQTTAPIAYNATAAAVRNALAALSTIAGAANVSVAGSAGGPYTVTFTGALSGTNAAALTASGAGLTGGSSPGVGVATSTEGGTPGSFVRAVRIIL